MSEFVPRDLRAEFGEGQLGDVPFAVEGEAGKYFVVAEREPCGLDALGAHQPHAQVTEMIVIGGGDG